MPINTSEKSNVDVDLGISLMSKFTYAFKCNVDVYLSMSMFTLET